MKSAEELVEFIRKRAHELGTSLTKIEAQVGLSNGRIGKWKTQKKYPPYDTLRAIAEILQVSFEELTGDGEEQKKSTSQEGSGLSPELAELFKEMSDLTPGEAAYMLEQAKRLKSLRNK